tara:strand:+ start:226 stop:471 length:246 start_codon:yes stop_codon:yes gene_type:complete
MMIYEPLEPFIESDTSFALARLMLPHRKYRLSSILELNEVAGRGSDEIRAALEKFADSTAVSAVSASSDDGETDEDDYFEL